MKVSEILKKNEVTISCAVKRYDMILGQCQFHRAALGIFSRHQVPILNGVVYLFGQFLVQ